MNVGIPPRSLNHRLPAAEDAPTASAASSLLEPFVISRQNNRSTSRRSDGFPGDFIGALPVSSVIHPAGLPISTSTLKVLRGPVETAQDAGYAFYLGVDERQRSWAFSWLGQTPSLSSPANRKPRHRPAHAGRERAKSKADEQPACTLEQDDRGTGEQEFADSQTRSQLARGRSQLQRVLAAREDARVRGDTRRAAKLDFRAKRIEGEIAQKQQELDAARHLTADGEHAKRASGITHAEERRQTRARWLDAQAALPDSGAPSLSGQRRDYPALAGLMGYERAEYERLSANSQRQARLDVDRELQLGRELSKLGREDARRSQASESPVMRDAREVAAARKRQLGQWRN